MKQLDGSRTVKGIQKALEVYSDNEQEFTFAGWELYNTLGHLAKTRLERIIKEYLRNKELFG